MKDILIENLVSSVHSTLNTLNEYNNLRLGELIDALSQKDQSKILLFENIDPSGKGYDELKKIYSDLAYYMDIDPHRSGVGRIHSWRGVYSQLAIQPSKKIRSVDDTLSELKGAVGKEFEGYKGDDFLMTESTLVWCSEYGESTGFSRTGIYEFDDGTKQPSSVNLAIKGVSERENEVVILYKEESDY